MVDRVLNPADGAGREVYQRCGEISAPARAIGPLATTRQAVRWSER
jgi:hypothetical protein